jgi:opacity protein-like surface antigen
MTPFIGLAGLLVVLGQSPQPPVPQQPPPAVDVSALAKKLTANDRLVVLDADGRRIDGRFAAITASELTLIGPTGRQNPIALPRISRIVREDSKKNGLLIGLAAGLGAGLVGGWMMNSVCENETGGCPEFFFILGSIGAASGAGIGAAADGMRKQVIYSARTAPVDEPAALGLFSPEVGANVGGGHATAFGAGMTMPVSIGASWSFRQKTGLGVRFDASQTLTESRHVVECVPDQSGRCVGSGEEGVNKIFIGTAQIQYFFPVLGRVQPYIGGGAGVHNSNVERAFPVMLFGRAIAVDSAPVSSTHAAMVVSGGTRIALTKSLSIDPSILFIDARDLTGVRASLGVAYAW